jgi:DNA-directed RNA polymerase subunit K/omega
MDTLPQRLMDAVNGSFQKTALLQKRVRELVRGGQALYETHERNPIKIAFEEMKRGLIVLVPEEETDSPMPSMGSGGGSFDDSPLG